MVACSVVTGTSVGGGVGGSDKQGGGVEGVAIEVEVGEDWNGVLVVKGYRLGGSGDMKYYG